MRNLSRAMIGLLLGTAMLIPSVAQAQERGRDRGDRGGERSWQRGGGQPRETIGGDRANRAEMARGRETVRAVERPAPVVQPQTSASDQSRRQWQGGNREWNRGDRGNAEGRRDWGRERANDDRQRDAARGSDDNRRRDWNRDRSDRDNVGRDNDGNQRWSSDRRDWNRDGRAGDRNWTSDRNRWDNRNDGRWDRNWRNDRRYSWQDYRNRNRQIYRLPRYNPPRWGYSYRRWSPGFRWDAWYYSSSYWIADPWQYRLPPAYGDYRWVRYYDDAVLVDIRSGEIIDIIYSFFF
ncbi:RcnB family protein [Rhizorhabdus dicambivorans]|nr:RcnB family protein [Rhizorhabdus dicambivorans]